MGKPTSLSLSLSLSLSQCICLFLYVALSLTLSRKDTNRHNIHSHDPATYTHIQNNPQSQYTKLHHTQGIQLLSYTVETWPSLSPRTLVFPLVLPGLCIVDVGHCPVSVAYISGHTHISVSLSLPLFQCVCLFLCVALSLCLWVCEENTQTHTHTHTHTHTYAYTLTIMRHTDTYKTTPRLVHTELHCTEGLHYLSPL